MHTATNHMPNNGSVPRDLRGGSPADAGAGKTYDVDPAAVERLKQHIAAKQAAPVASRSAAAAVPSVRRATPEPTQRTTDPAALYSPEVIAAAKEQEQASGRRNLTPVLTDEVLAIWDRWSESGISAAKIAQKLHNGLIDVHPSQVATYLAKYRERQEETTMTTLPQPETAVAPPAPAVEPVTKKPRLTGPGRKAVVVKRAVIDDAPAPTSAPAKEPETAVIEPAPEPASEMATEAAAADPLPKPEIEPLETAVAPFAVEHSENLPTFLGREYRPQRPGPGDALAALAALVNNEQLRIKGSVKLNLEIEFGD